MKQVTFSIQAARAAARKWRDENSEHDAGVVLVWEGEAYGWKDRLRDPAHERPGVYAVDPDGFVFVAQGGDDYSGAKCWVVVPSNT
mgnify:CR=1 FL=1